MIASSKYRRVAPLGVALRSSTLGFALLLFAACSSPSTEEVGGETHWVKCNTDGDCEGARTCECGLCSTTCDSNDDCKSLGATSVCALASESTQADECEPADAEKLCLPEQGSSNPSEPTGCDVPGIDATSNPECFSCLERLEAETEALSELRAESRFLECENDEDCGVVDIDSACAGRCGTVVALDQAAAFQDAKDAVTAMYCDAPNYRPTCSQIPECVALEVRCEEGACTGTPDLGPTCPPGESFVDGTCVGGMPTPVTLDVEGWKYDEALGCFVDLVVAGAATCNGGDGVLTIAVAPDDQCWLFPTSCLPQGFAAPGIDSPCAELEPQLCGMSGCGADEQLVMGECLSCEDAYTAQVETRSMLLEAYSNATCEADEDCAVVRADLTCRAGCPFALSQQDVEALSKGLSDLSDSVCDESAASMACEVPLITCLVTMDAGCIDGTCQIREPGALLQGSPFDEQGNCFLQPQAAGTSICQDGPPVISYGRAPDGTCWMFPSGCIPDEFMRIEAGGEPCSSTSDACEPAPADCSEARPEECASGCVLVEMHEQLDSCFAPVSSNALCVPDLGGCDDAETIAVDDAGTCWLFPNTCLPEGFTPPEPDQCLAEPTLCEPQ